MKERTRALYLLWNSSKSFFLPGQDAAIVGKESRIRRVVSSGGRRCVGRAAKSSQKTAIPLRNGFLVRVYGQPECRLFLGGVEWQKAYNKPRAAANARFDEAEQRRRRRWDHDSRPL